jgi:hypothetical protein
MAKGDKKVGKKARSSSGKDGDLKEQIRKLGGTDEDFDLVNGAENYTSPTQSAGVDVREYTSIKA